MSSESETGQSRCAKPRRARLVIRSIAATIDFALGFSAAVVLSSTVGVFFARRAVITLRIGQPGTLWHGPIPLILGIFGEVVYLLPLTLLASWMIDPLTGATVGKRIARVRVRLVDGRRAAPAQLWLRWTIQTVGLWGWTLALLTGSWVVALLASLAAAVVLLGALGAAGTQSLALHDRLSGTCVYQSE